VRVSGRTRRQRMQATSTGCEAKPPWTLATIP
jgi:hypothetical protein